MSTAREGGRAYADAVNAAFDEIFTAILDNQNLQSGTEFDFARDLKKLFDARSEAWYEEPHELLNQQGLSAYLNSLDQDSVLEFLLGISETTDYALPESVKALLLSLTPEKREAYLSLILAISPEAESDSPERLREIYRVNQLLPLVQLWPDPAIIDRVLAWFLAAEEPDERIADALGNYLKALGVQAALPLIEHISTELDGDRADKNGTDYLVQDLTAIAKFDESLRDRVYPILRKAFRVMSNKTITVLCLGDFGTARAIPLLRTYVEQNASSIDRALYYDILSAIQRLGGSTKDLPDPFGDFTRKGPQGPKIVEI